MIETMIILAIVALALSGRLNRQYHRTYADQTNLIKRQQAELGEMMRDGANLYERGLIQGMADTEAKWKAEPLYQAGWTACEATLAGDSRYKLGYQAWLAAGEARMRVELLGVVVDSRTAVERGELDQAVNELSAA